MDRIEIWVYSERGLVKGWGTTMLAALRNLRANWVLLDQAVPAWITKLIRRLEHAGER